jgi:hypothetical protein
MPLPPFDGDTSRDQHALIDGGVFANNPAACAYGEALDIYTGPDGPPEVHVVSLGTGTPRAETAVPYQRACNWGLAEWASPILHVVFDGVSKTVDHQMELLCRDVQGGAPHYYRIQGELVAADPAMDDASRENIRHLQQDAARIVERNAAKLDEACEALTKIAAERDGGMSGELLKRHQPYLRYARRRSEKPLT